LEQALQDLIDVELTAQIGADRHQRSESRSNYRNGGRPRMLSTPAGESSCGSRRCGWARSFRLSWSRDVGWIRRCGR
jgi:hypothetical protein